MHLKSIRLLNFKNYEVGQFSFKHNLISIHGDNGKGKTNLLDAIYYTCLGKSYFTALDKNISNWGKEFFRIESLFDDNGNSSKIVLKVKPGTLKEIEIDNVKLTKLNEHIGRFPVVMITPDDVHTLLQANEERRNFLNNIIVQCNNTYLDCLTLYNKLLKQRNALLKDFQEKKYYDKDLLFIITQRMSQPAKYIFEERKKLIEELIPHLYENYKLISNGIEDCRLTYTSQLETGDFMHLSDYALEKDRATGRTSTGIHKDEIVLELNGQSLKEYASQGQMKSYIFSLKLAQYSVLAEKTNTKPILLLDDIFDKLDPSRVGHLIDLIQKERFGQVFITDTHKGRVQQILGESECDVFEIGRNN